jgi:hypothetical protein
LRFSGAAVRPILGLDRSWLDEESIPASGGSSVPGSERWLDPAAMRPHVAYGNELRLCVIIDRLARSGTFG